MLKKTLRTRPRLTGMGNHAICAIITCIMVSSLVVGSCAPGATPAATPGSGSPYAAQATPSKAPAAPSPASTPKPAQQPKYGGVLTGTNMAVVPHFDLHQLSGASQRYYLRPVFSELVEWDPNPPNTAVVGGVAESWQNTADGLTWTFRLRKGIKFHNGAPMTSADVKFTLDRMREPPKGVTSPRKTNLSAIDKVETPDSDTVKVSLRNPQSAFLPMLTAAETSVYSAQAIQGGLDPKSQVVGTGAFKLKKYVPDISFELAKNDDYFIKGRPYLDGLTFYIIVDQATRFAAFRTGRASITAKGSAGLTPPQAEIVKREMKGSADAVRHAAMTFSYMPLNTSRSPWSDPRVRRAVSLAVDRQAAVSSIDQGAAAIGGYLVPGSEWATANDKLVSMPGYRQPKETDRAEAKKLLAEAGYPDGFEVNLTYGARDYLVKMAEFAAAQLATVGIKAKPASEEYSSFLGNTLPERKFSIAVFSEAIYLNDPDELLGNRYVTDAYRNFSAFSDKNFDDLYRKQSTTLDTAERKRIVSQLEQVLFDAPPTIVLLYPQAFLGIWDRVKDYHPGWGWFVGIKFADVWLEK